METEKGEGSQGAVDSMGPLRTLEELLHWKPPSEEDHISQCVLPARVPLHSSVVPDGIDDGKPKILCCHDMQGGYLDDSLALGGNDGEGYVFRHWQLIDYFVYFSHHLVTIPPPTWINASHKHGCPVFGTFITEWQRGSLICQDFLSTESKMQRCAQQLANIAQFYGFEGWIVNIENDLSKIEVSNMILFLKYLTQAMHGAIEGSKVIWYDAVTIEGRLEWQNTLNNMNIPFFDACDGIWINYLWREGCIGRIKEAAGSRANDVYLGVDCFGRGVYGGGELNTYMALDLAYRAEINIALFACAWPYERFLSEKRERNEDFLQIYQSWYDLDNDFWYRNSRAWKSRRPLVSELPFYSCFSIGSGRTYFINGKQTGFPSWYNLSLQSNVINPLLCKGILGGDLSIDLSRNYGLYGSNSLHIHGGISDSTKIVLFSCDVPLCNETGIGLRASISHTRGINARMILRIKSREDKKIRAVVEVKLCNGGLNDHHVSDDSESSFSSTLLLRKPDTSIIVSTITEDEVADNMEFKPFLGQHWVQNELEIAPNELPQWVFKDGILSGVDLVLRPTTAGSICKCNFLMGDIAIWSPEKCFPPPSLVSNILPSNTDLRLMRDPDGDVITGKSLSALLAWDPPQYSQSHFFIWMRTRHERKQVENQNSLDWGDPFLVGISPLPLFHLKLMNLLPETESVQIYVATESGGKIIPIFKSTFIQLDFCAKGLS